jgi:hypothetical protein
MRDIEHELRTVMQERAEAIGHRPRLPERMQRRARRRRTLAALSAGMLAVIVGLGAFTGVSAVLEERTPATKEGPQSESRRKGLVASGEFQEMSWELHARDGAEGEICRFVTTEHRTGGGGGGPACDPVDDGEIALSNLETGGLRLVDGMVPPTVTRLVLELDSGKTRELDLYDPPSSVKERALFFAVVLPAAVRGELVAYEGDGEIFDRQTANLTADLEPLRKTGPKLVVAEGKFASTLPWRIDGRATDEGPCVYFLLGKWEKYGGGGGCDLYGHYERKILSVHHTAFESVVDVTPVFGSLSSEVVEVRITMEDGSTVPVEVFAPPDGFDPEGLGVNDVRFYLAFPPSSSQQGTVEALDANGEILQEHSLCPPSWFRGGASGSCTDDNTPD